MPATTAVATALLKEVYENGLRYQINDEVTALKRVVRSSDNIQREPSARYVTFPIHVSRNSGIGARREMETLPVPGNQGTEAARVGLRYLYGGIQLSGQAMELVVKNQRAFVDQTDLETDRLKIDLAKDLNRQVYGNGSGQIATTSTAGGNTVATLTSGAQWMQPGMVIDVYTAANLAADSTPAATGVTVTNVINNGDGTGSITVTPSVTWVNGHVIVRSGNANREWTGLNAIIQNSGTLYNINSSTVPVWRAEVDDNAGVARPISENLITRMVDRVRMNGAKVSLLLTTLGVRRSYANLLMQQRQFVNQKQYEGGFAGLGFTTDNGEIPLVTDVDCTPRTMYGISEKNIRLYQEQDWSWMDRDGSMWDRIPGKDAYEARMFQYSELGTDRRNAHFRINDIQEA